MQLLRAKKKKIKKDQNYNFELYSLKLKLIEKKSKLIK